MTINEILESAKIDLKLEVSELDGESVRTPDIYIKYLKEHSHTKLRLKALKKEKAHLYAELRDYYLGDADPEVYDRRGEFLRTVLKKDLESYINTTEDWIVLEGKMDVLEEKAELLTKILSQITQRSFNIKNAIDWQKFQNGGTL